MKFDEKELIAIHDIAGKEAIQIKKQLNNFYGYPIAEASNVLKMRELRDRYYILTYIARKAEFMRSELKYTHSFREFIEKRFLEVK